MTAMLPRSVLTIIGLLCLWLLPAFGEVPYCFPAVVTSRVKVVRVERNGILVLEGGRAARLESVILPAGSSDHAPGLYAKQAMDRLAQLATGHAVLLAARTPQEDRYGRLRVQTLLADSFGERWLQRALLTEGLARVSIAPDRNECGPELFAAERQARAHKVGIWSQDAYRLRTPDQLADSGGMFRIVEGTVEDVGSVGGRVFLEFGRDRRKDFAVMISSDDLKNFRAIGVDPFSYRKLTIRVRGWIEWLRRPEMEVATPADIEVIEVPESHEPMATPR